MRYRGCAGALIVVVAALLTLAAWAPAASSLATAAELPRNIIIMFADGAASTQFDFGRYSSKVLRQQPFATTDVVLRQGVVGLLATSPFGAYVTDSAAAASAMSIGVKVKNGAISITPDGASPPTVMEAAKAAGKRIGLVTTAAVYDATPAAFALHTMSRRDSQALVDQLLALEPEVLMGGGADYFLPATVPGGKRKDGRDVVAVFRARGYAVARNPAELTAASGARLLGLFSDDDMDFEIERDPAREPTTAEMATAALKTLARQAPNGFVLLVENENIDTAAHHNDAASLMRALWAFDDAVKVALEFQHQHPDTLVIVTGDHETGGFSPTYALKDLSGVSASNRFYAGDEHLRMLGRITLSFKGVKEKLGTQPSGAVLDQVLAQHFPGFRLDPDLRELILGGKIDERNFSYSPQSALGRMVARQTGYYWGTSGHTPQPVLVGAIGPGAALFHGYQDNTDFAKHLHQLIRGK
ncbi:MAG: alkaline phosphatase [Candidatus Rokuibacteriota bacterium]